MNAQEQRSHAFQSGFTNVYKSDNVTSLGTQVTRVRVPGNDSSWIQKLTPKLKQIVALPDGWDGYDGQPVSFDCAWFAANLIETLFNEDVPCPQIVPGSDGTLQIEWHINDFDIELDILAPYQVVATRLNIQTDNEDELELDANYIEVTEWITELKPHSN